MNDATLQLVLERLSRYVEALRERYEMPGVQVALTNREKTLATLEFGYANLDAKIPVRADHLFEFGSIGKSFTAICLLQLEAEGKVNLTATLDSQLPWWSIRTQFEPATIEHMLSHTAGIVSGTDFTPEQRYEAWSLRNTDTLTAPGAAFHYSNAAYKSLGLLIEHVTGKAYGEVVRERIFEPLGMTNVAEAITNEMRPRLAIGYQDYFDDRPRISGRGVVPAPWLESDSGDGCLSASAGELAVYLRMFLNRGEYSGGRILTEEQFVRMTMNRCPPRANSKYGYGFGLAVPASDDVSFLGHGGGMVGYISSMESDPSTGFGAIAFTNSMNGVSDITDYALLLLAAAETGADLPNVPALPTGDYAGHLGTWAGRTGSIVITDLAGDLLLERDGQTYPLSKTQDREGNLVDARPNADLFPYVFHRNDDGAITEVTHGAESWVPEGVDLPEETDPALLALTGHYRSNNPWQSNFRIVARGSRLLRISPDGSEYLLERDGDSWRANSDEDGAERFWIDVFVPGKVARVRDQLGSSWELVFTP